MAALIKCWAQVVRKGTGKPPHDSQVMKADDVKSAADLLGVGLRTSLYVKLKNTELKSAVGNHPPRFLFAGNIKRRQRRSSLF